MRMISRLPRLAIYGFLLSASCALVCYAQPGHGGMPPGQAKHHDEGRDMPPGQARHHDEDRDMPRGEGRRHFRDEDRGAFYGRYRVDAEHWRGRRRPVFVPGEYIAREYIVQPVPQSVWVNVVAPPPPGLQYGYYGGFVVAYSPTTRIVADVLDLVDAARSR